MSDNLHTGHRSRMIDRFLSSPDSLSEHEKLEIFLFGVVPRKDTNALAHTLINTFGSLDGVFNASAKGLMSVKGVGKQIATHILVTAKILEHLDKSRTNKKDEYWSSFEVNKQYLARYFNEDFDEKFMIFLLNDKYKLLSKLEFRNKSKFNVVVDVPELVEALAVFKPKYLIVCHNHPSGDSKPSEVDDFTTKKLNILCQIHGVVLSDHIIVAKNEYYSYHVEGRLDYVKQVSGVERVLKAVNHIDNSDL